MHRSNSSSTPAAGPHAARRLRTAVIGCGLIAQVAHLPHLRQLDDRFQVVALCDIAPHALEFASRLFPAASRHAEWEAALAEPLDAVLILTPTSHAPIAIAAAQRGLHVFVEKPMCFTAAEGRAMIASADAAGVVLMVGYMKRYDPAYQELARTLDLKALHFARITTFEAPIEPYALHHPRPPSRVDANGGPPSDDAIDGTLADELGTSDRQLARAYRVGLLDSMVHELNGVRGLLGEPTELRSAYLWGAPRGFVVHAAFGAIEAVFSWIDLPGIARYEQDWGFYADDQRMQLKFPSPLLLNAPTELIVEGGESGGVAAWRTSHTVSYLEAFKRELEEFHTCVVTASRPLTDGLDGLRDVLMAQAIVRAHRTGAPVPHPTATPERTAVGQR